MMALAVLVPAMLSAQATVGFYFDFWPGVMSDWPPCYIPELIEWEAYLYLHNSNLSVTAVEYALYCPADPNYPNPPVQFTISAIDYPELYSIDMGDPFSGHSIAYWPYLNGYSPGYNLLCKYTCRLWSPCWIDGGAIADYPVIVGPHPGSGAIRGTYYPDNKTFPIIGLTSIICPYAIATEESSWGAIKGQFK
jgi:hypothetical protein